MGKKVILVMAIILAGAFCSRADFREFTSTDGKTIRAKVQNYIAKTRTVTVQLENKRIKKVPITIFCEADQNYILEWNLLKGFTSESMFRMEASRKKTKNKDESYSNMNSKTDVTDYGFELTFDNRSASPLNNIEVKYCIFYEQEKNNRGKKVTDQGVYCGSFTIDSMRPKSKEVVLTDTVTVFKAELDADWYYTSGAGNVIKGDVHGIWVRAYMTTPSGQKVSREFCMPDSLRNKRGWTTSSKVAGRNRGRRK